MSSLTIIGMVGAFLLAGCAIPQALKSVNTGSAKDLSWSFLAMWGLGDVMMLIYSLPTGSVPLIVNYGLNALLIAVIIRVKILEVMR